MDERDRSPTPPMPSELRSGYVPAALQTTAGGSKHRTVAKDPLVEATAEERELTGEMVLINAFEDVLHVGLEHLTPLCKEARISQEQIKTHTDEIGVEETLTKEQITGLDKFV